MRLKNGVDLELEEMADELLRKSREGVTAHSQKKDFLTQSQLDRRRSREILPAQGYPEDELYHGMTRRVYVPGREKGPRDLRTEDDIERPVE